MAFRKQTELQWTHTQNEQLRERFQRMKSNLDAVFIDSSAKSPYYGTSNEQNALERFNVEVQKLWDFLVTKDSFHFETVDHVQCKFDRLRDLKVQELLAEALPKIEQLEKSIVVSF